MGGEESLSVESVRTELQRLRQGHALGRPIDALRLSPGLRLHMTGSADGDADDVVRVVSALRRAISGLSRDQAPYALVDLNLLPEHSYATLTARQESLAAAMSCAAKTIRRRSDAAMQSLALGIVTGERGRAILLPDTDASQLARTRGGAMITPQPSSWRATLSEFWGLAPRARVDLVCSEIPEDERPEYASPSDRNYLRYAKFADLDGLLYVRSQLLQIEPDLHVRDFAPSEHHGDDADTLVVIGGPPWNAKYREFLPQLPYYFEPHPLGEDDPLVIPMAGDVRLGPTWSPNTDLLTDVAVFTRLTLGQGTTVVLLGGCLTLGVLGAAKVFLQREQGAANTEYIDSLVGSADVVVVIRTSRVGDITEVPDLTVVPPLLILARRPSGQFEVVMKNTAVDVDSPRIG